MPNPKDHIFFADAKNIPEVIAHRGGAGQWPGETIYAFEEALKTGVDVLEMDIRFTSDEIPVLMHDRNARKTTGKDKRVDETPSAEIAKWSAAFGWPDASFPPGSESKLKVPTLESVLKRFEGVRMVIEIKPFKVPERLIQSLGDMIRKAGAAQNVLIASGCSRNLYSFRELFSEIATSASLGELASFRALKDLGYKPNCSALQLGSKFGPLHFITPKYVEAAHERGFKVHGWTVNQPQEMKRLILAGVDGIITDYPAILLRILNRI